MMPLVLTPSFFCDREAWHMRPCHMTWQFETHASQLNSSDKSVPDIPPNMHKVSSGPGRGRWPESPHDIYCCIKRFAADQQLSQDIECLMSQNPAWHGMWPDKTSQFMWFVWFVSKNEMKGLKTVHGDCLPLGTSLLAAARSHAWFGLLPSWIFWTRCLKSPGLSKLSTRIENWSLCS